MKLTKCLNPGCKRTAATRGLCHSCYNAVAGYVRRGLTTWENLERQGKAKPPQGKLTSNVKEWAIGK